MLGERLKALRVGKNMTQRELAKELNVTPGAICLWEMGEREPDYDNLLLLSKFFGVTLDYLSDSKAESKIVIIRNNGGYKTFYLNDKDLNTLEALAESLDNKNKNNKD